MNNKPFHFLVLFCLGILFVSGCATMQYGTYRSEPATVIYVATNKADGNTLVGYRNIDGRFEMIGEYKTGGLGTGDLEIPALKKDETHPLANGDDPLISAYGIVATDDGRHVLAVNAGDASISLLKRDPDLSLTLVNKAKAGDKFPVSIAASGNRVVVASVGKDNMNGSISAYEIDAKGKLKPVADSRRDLKARPSTVAFTRDGRFLVVNELVTGKIKVFSMVGRGLSKNPISVVDSPRPYKSRFHAIPVGFDMAAGPYGDIVLMSEARFLTPEFGLREEANVVPQMPKYSWQTGSLSTYLIDGNGKIKLMSADILTGKTVEGGEIANCWVVISHDQKTLWAANALSSSISTFSISANGSASLKNATAYKDFSEMLFFSDINISPDGKLLFQLVGNQGKVIVFDILAKGNLSVRQTLSGLPELGTYGLIVL